MTDVLRRAGTRLVNALRRGLSWLLPYRPMAGGDERLDREYRDGVWDYLRDLGELSRFSVIVGYCHHLKPQGEILEIGCGEGLLHSRLDQARFARYLGTDISAAAIHRATQRVDGKSGFVVADAVTFSPQGTFDVIVFNECLEYFSDPAGLVRRYRAFLKPDGVYIVSMFVGLDTARTERIWRMLAPGYRVTSLTRVTNDEGFAWVIKVLTPT
ncbi:MAG: class I SAM-dependent methyltransferase [Gemmatimonadales bacterium]